MKRTIPRQLLYTIDKEYRDLAKTNPGVYFMLESKIIDFRKKNKLHLEVMNSRFIAVQSKYVKKDEHGNFKTAPYGQKTEWDWVDTYVDVENATTLTREEVRLRFDEELAPFFAQSVTIEY